MTMKDVSEFGIIGGWFSISALFALSFYKGGNLVSLLIQLAEYLFLTAVLFLIGYLAGGFADTIGDSKVGKTILFILFMSALLFIYYSVASKFFSG